MRVSLHRVRVSQRMLCDIDWIYKTTDARGDYAHNVLCPLVHPLGVKFSWRRASAERGTGAQQQQHLRGTTQPEECAMATGGGGGSALPWANRTTPLSDPASVPPLTSLALDSLAANAHGLTCIRGVDIHLCAALLYRVLQRGGLDYRLACVFRDCGHADIADAVGSLDLLAAMPTHNSMQDR